MEAYAPSSTGSVLRYLSAWTTELHKLGYQSGVYSSSDSAVVDLARQYKKHQFAMPDVIYDALWNGSRTVADKVFQSGEWTGGRRMHQFSGDVLQTFGGDTMDVDQDYLDVTRPAPGGTLQDSPGSTSASRASKLFYQGTDHRLWESRPLRPPLRSHRSRRLPDVGAQRCAAGREEPGRLLPQPRRAAVGAVVERQQVDGSEETGGHG